MLCLLILSRKKILLQKMLRGLYSPAFTSAFIISSTKLFFIYTRSIWNFFEICLFLFFFFVSVLFFYTNPLYKNLKAQKILKIRNFLRIITAKNMKFSIKDFLSNCDQIRSFLPIWPHLLKKSFMENFVFCAVHIMLRLAFSHSEFQYCHHIITLIFICPCLLTLKNTMFFQWIFFELILIKLIPWWMLKKKFVKSQ